MVRTSQASRSVRETSRNQRESSETSSTLGRDEGAAVLLDVDDALVRELLQRGANQRSACSVDLADLVLAEFRAGQQAMLEDRRSHTFPDAADAIARIWRVGFRSGLDGHGGEDSIVDEEHRVAGVEISVGDED